MQVLLCPGRVYLLGAMACALGTADVEAGDYSRYSALLFAQTGSLPNETQRNENGEVDPCDEGDKIITYIFSHHYRNFMPFAEIEARWQKAMRKQFLFLPVMKDEDIETVLADLSRDGPIVTLENNGFQFDCQAFHRLAENFGSEVSAVEVWDAFLNALLSEMDPHSYVVHPQAGDEFDEMVSGKAIGIGVEFERNSGGTFISNVTDGSPAHLAGIGAGDEIVAVIVDGRRSPVREISITDVKRIFATHVGQSIELEINKKGGGSIRAFVTPGPVEVRFVSAQDLPGNLLYLHLTSFGLGAAQQLEAEIVKRPYLKGIILDLRFNPGGRVDVAGDVVDLFVDQGIVASPWNRVGKTPRNLALFAHNPGVITNVPVVVLVNDFSGSASELVAQSFKDYGRGIVVGRTTWGKGSMAIVYPLFKNRYLVLTEYMYHTMSGVSPQAVGVKPDIESRDVYVEQILEERKLMVFHGAAVQPMREADYPFALPPVRPLIQEQREFLGGTVEPNPMAPLIASLPPGVRLEPRGAVGDPALTVSMQVLKAYLERCGNYAAKTCPEPPVAGARTPVALANR
ncbi:MAG TPA: S41 family peptidase [Bdellovibrionota bacterium]|nr:S41 family peptidase [Bdellovibrionota bacterium]